VVVIVIVRTLTLFLHVFVIVVIVERRTLFLFTYRLVVFIVVIVERRTLFLFTYRLVVFIVVIVEGTAAAGTGRLVIIVIVRDITDNFHALDIFQSLLFGQATSHIKKLFAQIPNEILLFFCGKRNTATVNLVDGVFVSARCIFFVFDANVEAVLRVRSVVLLFRTLFALDVVFAEFLHTCDHRAGNAHNANRRPRVRTDILESGSAFFLGRLSGPAWRTFFLLIAINGIHKPEVGNANRAVFLTRCQFGIGATDSLFRDARIVGVKVDDETRNCDFTFFFAAGKNLDPSLTNVQRVGFQKAKDNPLLIGKRNHVNQFIQTQRVSAAGRFHTGETFTHEMPLIFLCSDLLHHIYSFCESTLFKHVLPHKGTLAFGKILTNV